MRSVENELLAELYRRYRRELYLYLYSLCGSAPLAEDLLQETFLKALLSLSESHSNMRAWLYLVGRNLCFNYCRKEKLKVSLEALPEPSGGEPQAVLDRLLEDEKKRTLYQALGQLKQKKREVLVLQYFGGLSQKEIAAILQISPENVRVLACRARRELKIYLEVRGYDLS